MSNSVITVFVVVVLVAVVVPHFWILYSVYSKEQIQNISNEFRPQYKSKSIKTTIKTYVLESNENLNKIIVTLVTQGLPSSFLPSCFKFTIVGSCCVRLHGD